MPLSSELISEFAKITKDDSAQPSEKVVYGTIVERDGQKYVQIDGSDMVTPISSTTLVSNGERVTAMIKNHSVTVTGNLSSPSVRTAEIEGVNGSIAKLETSIDQTAAAIELKANKTDPASSVQTSTVKVTATGVNIATGGTFTVDSGNFELDSSGNMSAQNAYMSGSLFANGYPVLSSHDVYIGTSAPTNPHSGMVWIKPDASTSSTTTLSKKITWGDRKNMVANIKTGTLTGSATAAVGSVYTYKIKVPVYIQTRDADITGGVLHFDVATTSGGDPVLEASKTVLQTEYGSGNKVVEITLTSSTWLGSYSSLYFTLYVTRISGYYAYNVLNSSDNTASITLECTSKSSSGATGWRECQIYSYA